MSPLEPRTPKEHIIDEAMELISRRVEEEGLTLRHVFVTFHVEEGRPGDNAATGFHFDPPDDWDGDADAADRELFAFLLAQTKGVGEQLGLNVLIGGVQGGPMS